MLRAALDKRLGAPRLPAFTILARSTDALTGVVMPLLVRLGVRGVPRLRTRLPPLLTYFAACTRIEILSTSSRC